MRDEIAYFAYGCNLAMDPRLVADRSAHSPRVAKLVGYRVAFNKRDADGHVYANLMPAPGDVAWGVVYQCNAVAIAVLDEFEGVPTGDYTRETVIVETRDGRPLSALAYFAGADFVTAEGRPSGEYFDLILAGARQHHLPLEYVQRLTKLARGE